MKSSTTDIFRIATEDLLSSGELAKVINQCVVTADSVNPVAGTDWCLEGVI